MLSRTIGDYHFLADKYTGITFRWGKTFEDNPKFAPIPELADISISNRCTKGCSFCYRSSTPDGSVMSLKDYCDVLDSMKSAKFGNVFQVALGGGEPLEHPDFIQLINETVRRGVVPNFTTNGNSLTIELVKYLKGKVGSLAISMTDISDIERFESILTTRNRTNINIHFILSNKTINQAIEILEGRYNFLLSGVNAIVFLTYKPAGRGNSKDILRNDERLRLFLSLTRKSKVKCKIGFDACFVPMLLRNSKELNNYVDFCEGGFFSVYINEKKEVSPCSFSNGKDSYSLDKYDFYDIWLNKFKSYRKRVENNCTEICQLKGQCWGFCQYYPQITACYK